MKVGVLTGGGDAPGLNGVVRAVVKVAATRGVEIVGVEDGFRGLVEPNRWRRLTPSDVSGILREGGTILGTTNHANPLSYPSDRGGVADHSSVCVDRYRELGLDGLIAIGGDGTLTIAHALWRKGLNIVGIPKTIDNDVAGTAVSLGFDTAVNVATEAVDRLHTTAESHHRIMVLEVMGRYTGWIALHAGIAGGADVILIPEIPFDLACIAARILERERLGARFSIVVAAEGATPRGGERAILEAGSAAALERLGGIGGRVAAGLEQATGREARSVLLGHVQRGAAPSAFDRLLATQFGARAMELVLSGQFGTMVTFNGEDLGVVALDTVVGRTSTVPEDSDGLRAARAIGVSFGD
jgi:ATP-dependent phosphofructokinase / diphosphate-dependent phosphofructokinase